MGSFPFFCFSKVGVRCIIRPPNNVSKIWVQILGLYNGIYGIYSKPNKSQITPDTQQRHLQLMKRTSAVEFHFIILK